MFTRRKVEVEQPRNGTAKSPSGLLFQVDLNNDGEVTFFDDDLQDVYEGVLFELKFGGNNTPTDAIEAGWLGLMVYSMRNGVSADRFRDVMAGMVAKMDRACDEADQREGN